jgi:hypothetical protein
MGFPESGSGRNHKQCHENEFEKHGFYRAVMAANSTYYDATADGWIEGSIAIESHRR